MYAVIFRANIIKHDDEYSLLASKMRERAFDHYNCIDFISLSEGTKEIAISYWENLNDIECWKKIFITKKHKKKVKIYGIQIIK